MSPLRRLWNLFRAARIDNDLRQEVDTHLELIEDEERAGGLGVTQARRQARARFGSPLAHRERAHDAVVATGLEDAWKDTRLALRSLARNPEFTVVALLTLGLGIGANTAIFSIVNGVLLQPLKYPKPDQLMFLNTRFPALGFPQFTASVPEYQDFRRLNQSFANVGAFRIDSVNLSADDRAVRVRSAAVDEHLLNVLGVQPLEGRLFAEGETAANNPLPGGPAGGPARAFAPPPVVILSFELWQRAFGGRPILAQSIEVDGRRLEVIGIMPRGFDLADNRTEVWLPLGLAPYERQQPGAHNLFLIGRLKEGVTAAQAQAELDALMANWADRVGVRPGNGPVAHILIAQSGPTAEALVAAGVPKRGLGHILQMEPLADWLVAGARRSIWALQAVVAFVLLIACANLGNLLLARAETRRREFAVRTALGASRGRLIRHSIIESVLLSAAGGALGVWIATVALRGLVRAYPTSLPRMQEVTLDVPVLLFTLAVSVGVGLLFGLAPIAEMRMKGLMTALKEEGGRGGTGASHRVRKSLVVSEVAMAVIVVLGAALLVRTVYNLTQVDAGFDRSRLVTFSLGLPLATTEPADRFQLYQNVLTGLRGIAGVENATAMTGLPPNRPVNANGTEFDGYISPTGANVDIVDYFQNVMSSYFETMGIPIVQGRSFQSTDAASTGAVAIVNETLAKKVWAGKNAIGQRLRRVGGPPVWLTVIGVARDVKQGGVDQRPGSEVYTFVDQTASGPFTMNIVARTRLPLASIAQTVERIVREKDPTVPIVRLREMDEVFAESIERPRLLAQLLASFAGLALLLAAIGTYGILSYMVTERRREIGIRLALGADRAGILLDVVKQGMGLTIVGIAIGVAGALGLGRLVASLLFGVQPTDGVTLAAVVATMILVATAACCLPAWRASRVDPMLVLRDE